MEDLPPHHICHECVKNPIHVYALSFPLLPTLFLIHLFYLYSYLLLFKQINRYHLPGAVCDSNPFPLTSVQPAVSIKTAPSSYLAFS